MLAPAILLKQHMERDRESVKEYDEILSRWEGSADDVERGYLEELRRVQLHRKCPDWLEQFVQDLNTAGLELGYLAAGRSEKQEEALDPIDESVKDMFE